jgi:hypothetical protein
MFETSYENLYNYRPRTLMQKLPFDRAGQLSRSTLNMLSQLPFEIIDAIADVVL